MNLQTTQWPRVIAAHGGSFGAAVCRTTHPAPRNLAAEGCVALPVERVARRAEGVLGDKTHRRSAAYRVGNLIPSLLRSDDAIIKQRTGNLAAVTTLDVVRTRVAACPSPIDISIAHHCSSATSGNIRILPHPYAWPVFRRRWAVSQHFRRKAGKRTDGVNGLVCATAQGDACAGEDERRSYYCCQDDSRHGGHGSQLWFRATRHIRQCINQPRRLSRGLHASRQSCDHACGAALSLWSAPSSQSSRQSAPNPAGPDLIDRRYS